MSEKMTPIPFRRLMTRLISEYAREGTVFGVHAGYRADGKTLPIFGEAIETPYGPAAGPNSQLAQNIIAAYFAGARFFELKTVQKMDGAELAACVPRPCILASDEGYNQEWSTELTVPQAMNEYIKAWCALKMIAHVYDLGSPDGFVFNMSVGYDLEGIRSGKIDSYLNGMMDASQTEQFLECKQVLRELFPNELDYIVSISPNVSASVTVSTLHGCPPQEIERIATYLILEKGLNTFVKCNPTILGYQTARSVLDGLGYDYIVFDEHHFREDLQWEDAVPMFTRLKTLAENCGFTFGLKLSNTFPVDTTRGELPNSEMYMSGRSLFPLTVEMCSRFSRAFEGKMRLSFAGGADAENCDQLFAAGVWPITVATTILKPGGYNRLRQMVEKTQAMPYRAFSGTDTAALSALSAACRKDPHYRKALKELPSRKNDRDVPLLDCFTAPCQGGCPFGQDIPEYMELCRKRLYAPALKLITGKNPLPFLTGTICAHRCQTKCTRTFYESPVAIRDAKLLAAQKGYSAVLAAMQKTEKIPGKKAAIVGGGPTGIAAAYFLARAGIETTIFEREEKLGGIPRYVIPAFRISDEALDRDIALMERYGVEVRCGAPAPSLTELKAMGYTHILLATGAWKPGKLAIPGSVVGVLAWMKELKQKTKPCLSGHVCIVGAGNTAMDAARLALRMGAESASILYRRTKKYMPADEQELQLALDEGVQFVELSSPIRQEYGKIVLERMQLGSVDSSGRRAAEPTGVYFERPCDLVVSAVGEQVDDAFFADNGIAVGRKGVEFFTGIENVYCAGDAHRGPATVAEGIADAARFAELVIGKPYSYEIPAEAYASVSELTLRKGVLKTAGTDRCLGCNTVCENCVDVCPNRANTVIRMPDGRHEILHLDALCNECGSCTQFCPYASEPCHHKFTLFQTQEDFEDSRNPGVLFLSSRYVRVRLQEDRIYDLAADNALPRDLETMILTIRDKYGYLL